MMTDWMVYCALWSLPISAAAWLAERILRRGSAPLRAVWMAAIALSIAGPAIGYYLPRAAAAPSVAPPTPVVSSGTVVTVFAAATHTVVPRTIAPTVNLLAVVWPALSLVMLLYVAVGFVRLHHLRRGWRAANVDGTPVMVSENTGPAVVGVVRTAIVIPEWVLRFDARRLSLVLRHEREHQRAGDASVLALAQLALVAVPWNPVAWWQVRRLRLAIELDCDARVLRAEPDVRSYGNLLLEVGQPRGGLAFAGASLSGRAAELEQRIRMMTRRARGVSRVGAGSSIVAGLVAIGVGCGLPAPKHPSSSPPTPSTAVPTATPVTDTTIGSVTKLGAPAARPRRTAAAAYADSIEAQLHAPLADRVRSLLDSLRTSKPATDTTVTRLLEELRRRIATDSALQAAVFSEELRRRIATDSAAQAAALRAARPELIESDSAAVASGVTACSAGVGSDDSYVIKLLVADSLARRDGQIDIDGGAASGDRTSITLNGAEKDFHLMTCSFAGAGILRLYGPEAFTGQPIVVSVVGPTSVIVTTGTGRLVAGPILVMSENRKYQMKWTAPR